MAESMEKRDKFDELSRAWNFNEKIVILSVPMHTTNKDEDQVPVRW